MIVPSFPLRPHLPAVVVLLAFALAAAVPPAAAQSSGELQSLTQKVDRLQRELNDLQRSVYRGEVPEAGGQTAAQSGEAGLGRTAAARIQRRLDDLEQELKRLTGQLEEARFQMRKVNDRLDRLVADVDYRLRQLEEGGGPGQASSAQDAEVAAQVGGAGEAAPETAATEDTGGGTATTGQPRSLGQVSQEAVDAIREQARQGETQAAASGTGGYELPDADPQEQYRHAFGLLRQADYAKAEQALRAFVEAHPEHELAGNAKYWLGETYYVRGDYDRAAVTFAEGFQAYPDNNKAPDNLLKLGMSLARIDRNEDACGIFAELLKRYPDAAANILQRAQRERQRLGCTG